MNKMTKNERAMVREYRSEIAEVKGFQDVFLESRSKQAMVFSAKQLKEGIADCGFSNIVQPRMFDELGNIRWDFTTDETGESHNTFYLYYRGLRPLYVLASSYEETGNESDLYMADRMLTSFYEFFKGETLQSEMLFNDHAQSERILNIIFLWNVAKKAGFTINAEAALFLISDAVEKLSGDTYYQKNHNHGIIVDRACLAGLYFLNRDDCMESIGYIASRLKQQVDYAFAADGIHKENSIDYHYSVLDLLTGCSNALSIIKHPYLTELTEVLKGTVEYLVYALKPNLKRPLFGDSKGEQAKHIKRIPDGLETFGNSHMQYVATQGREGECPPKLFARFSSGYVFMRQHFNKMGYQDATWVSFRAGYSTRVHKHSDDLSVCLYSKGNDIFVDPGMHSYMYGDSKKNYMESAPAHTTVCVRELDGVRLGGGNGWAFKIQRAQSRPEYDYVMASARGYDGIAIYRHLYYLRQMDTLVIRDECISDTVHTYAQYYHLGTNMMIPETVNEKSVCMKMKDTPYAVTLQQLEGDQKVRVLCGEKTQPMSLMSTGFNECMDSETLEYTKTATSTTFISVVDIHQCEDDCCKCSLTTDSSVLTVEKLGRKIDLPLEKSVPISFDAVTTQVKETNELVIAAQGDRFTKHTAYVFNDIDGSVIKLPYTKETHFSVDISDVQQGTVVYFVANDTSENLKGLLGKWEHMDPTTKGEFTQFPKIVEPWKCSATINKTSAPTYEFQICAEENLEAIVSWWIYRNGSLFDFKKGNELKFQTELTVPGDYVVMCGMRNKYFGEFFFHQFEKIVVK